jgi:SPP1 gp7 family putative phage head morphogenesis protein
MLLQGQVNLILASIHEKHQEYYELIMKHKLQEFHRAEQMGKRLVKRQQQSAMKATKPVRITANRDNLFGTLQYSEDKLANDTFKASQNTLNRVDNNINDILLDGYKSGVGINEVSRQITERFDQLRTWEAKRIARTEIHTAQNMGVMNSYDQLGVEYTQWISAEDSRTRESHVEIDREIIPIGSTYSNGLRFPGDTSGPIEEWINCRCSNAPFVLPAGMMAPSFSPFREEDLIPIETEPIQQEPQQR